jgi:hypothetical protein
MWNSHCPLNKIAPEPESRQVAFIAAKCTRASSALPGGLQLFSAEMEARKRESGSFLRRNVVVAHTELTKRTKTNDMAAQLSKVGRQ